MTPWLLILVFSSYSVFFTGFHTKEECMKNLDTWVKREKSLIQMSLCQDMRENLYPDTMSPILRGR